MVDDRDFRELMNEDTLIPLEVERKTQQAYAMIRSGDYSSRRRRKRAKPHISFKAVGAVAAAACILLSTGLLIGNGLSGGAPWLSSILEFAGIENHAANNPDEQNQGDMTNASQAPTGNTFSNDQFEITVDGLFCDGYTIEVTSTLRLKEDTHDYEGFVPELAVVDQYDRTIMKYQTVTYDGVDLPLISDQAEYLPAEDGSSYTCTALYDLTNYRYTRTETDSLGNTSTLYDIKAVPETLDFTISIPGFTAIQEEIPAEGQPASLSADCTFRVSTINSESENTVYIVAESDKRHETINVVSAPSGLWIQITADSMWKDTTLFANLFRLNGNLPDDLGLDTLLGGFRFSDNLNYYQMFRFEPVPPDRINDLITVSVNKDQQFLTSFNAYTETSKYADMNR